VPALTAGQASKYDLGETRDGIPKCEDVQKVLVGVLETLFCGDAPDGSKLIPHLQEKSVRERARLEKACITFGA